MSAGLGLTEDIGELLCQNFQPLQGPLLLSRTAQTTILLYLDVSSF